MARLWAKTVTFQSVSVGDQLPILVKWETRESIQRLNARVSDASQSEDLGSDELTLSPAALRSYVTEMLEKAFPISSLTAPGSRVELDQMPPVEPGDIISLSGRVVAKREEDQLRLVECQVLIEGEDGKTIGRAVAVVPL